MQPQCATPTMMHGVSRPPTSSWQGGCPTVAEHQEFMRPMQSSMQPDVILPNPGYKIETNLWNLDVQRSVHIPSPLASLLRHCNTMDTPYLPNLAREVRNQLMISFSLNVVMRLWRTSRNFRNIARNSSLKPLVVVYGLKAFKSRSRMSKKRSNHGSHAWRMSLSTWNVFTPHGSINCRIKMVPLRLSTCAFDIHDGTF